MAGRIPRWESPLILFEGEWSEPEKKIFVYTMEEAVPRCKLAAFDMDGTLITTASGAKWPKDKSTSELLT